MDTKVIS